MTHPRIARRYARALMSVAEEQKAVDATADDLALIGRALASSRELHLLFASPVVSEGKKITVVRELFGTRIGPVTASFIELLIRKHRVVQLQEVIAQFLALRDELRGVIGVDVTAAVAIETKQEKALVKELERRTGKTVALRLAKDPAIMGGLVIKIGDTVLDSSIRHQLARLREVFAGTARTTTH